MNFDVFPGVQKHSDNFFWTIAAPVCTVVLLILLREWINRWIIRWADKSLITSMGIWAGLKLGRLHEQAQPVRQSTFRFSGKSLLDLNIPHQP